MKKIDSDKRVPLFLKQYEGEYLDITFYAKETSSIYKVKNAHNESFALKIYEDIGSSIDDTRIELLILEEIKKNNRINSIELIRNRNGVFISHLGVGKAESIVRATLSKWIDGTDFKSHESPELFFKLGQKMALLHSETPNVNLPESLRPKMWNQVFYFRDEEVVYHDEKYATKVNDEFKRLMDEAIPLFDRRLNKIYQSDSPILLHGDLNPWNIKIVNDAIVLLDFEDAILGSPIHEIAIFLHYYKEDEKFSYELVKENVLAGYGSITELDNISDEDLTFLSMARTLNFLNYVLQLDEDHSQFIEKGLVKLKLYLSAYAE